MKTKVGINGFGRIGRQVFKIAFDHPNIEFVAVNDLADPRTLATLLKHDSVFREYKKEVSIDGDYMVVGGKKIRVFAEKDPTQIPWGELGVKAVVESTGLFRSRDKAALHLRNGVSKVIISSSAKGVPADISVVMGINDNKYDASKHHVISNVSCTTNAFAHLVKVVHENFKIKRGIMTTVHSYTNDQRILDQPHKDIRRARAAAMSMIPTTTNSATAIYAIFPELEGKLSAMSLRVPTPDASLVDFAVEVEKATSVQEVNETYKKAANKYFGYTEEPLVSTDYIGDSHAGVFDATLTVVIEGTFLKLFAWYDNEWGYSTMLVHLLDKIARDLN